MSIIPEVKCRRCGETFPATRSSCPNCGTRRVTQSSRTPGTTPGTVKGTASYERAETNTKWQMIFGLILIVAVILAVIVMVSTSLNGEDQQTGSKVSPTIPGYTEPGTMPTPDTAPTPDPTPEPTIDSVTIYFNNIASNWVLGMGADNREYPGYDSTLHLNDPEEKRTIHVVPVVMPATISVSPDAIHWSSEDPDVLKVEANEKGEADITIVGTKAGGVVITVEIYGVQSKMRVYCVK